MQFQCPKCQSRKLMPVANANTMTVKPNIPTSLKIFLPSIFVLLILVLVSIIMFVIGNKVGVFLQSTTIIAFFAALISGAMFWKDMPNFKIEMQNFMQNQRHWKCRDCNHDWRI